MFSRTSIFRMTLVLALGFLSVVPSRAGTVATYSDYASWSAAMAGITNVTIPDPGAGTSGLGFTLIGSGNASVTYSGVIFSQSGGPLQLEFFNVGVAWSGFPAVVSSEVLATGSPTGLANILITLPGDVTGLALYYGTWFGTDVTFGLSNGDSVVLGSTTGAFSVPDFLGLTDTTPFDSVLATSPDSIGLNLNDVSYGTAIPEPATCLLMAGGLAAAALLRRRRVN